MVIQPDFGVGQVVIVDQDQVGPLVAGQLRHLGALAFDVHLDPVPPGQAGLVAPGGRPSQTAPRAAVVQPDRDAVRAEHRMAGGRLLDHREGGEPALGVAPVLGPQRVHARGLQPLL
jgi:hypothetical protein